MRRGSFIQPLRNRRDYGVIDIEKEIGRRLRKGKIFQTILKKQTKGGN